MGIQGLLPFLKKIHTPVNIGKFKGSTVAVDAYCWLHKGAFSCAEKLALGEKTDQYVYYCLKYIDYMQKQELKVIMVFDGCHLESKADVEKNRRERRESNRKKAAQFLREGKRSEAKECLQRCVDISPQMALELMKACRARGVDCIVAPYEADAQLAYLSDSGIAQIIVTEDSDLLLFGCEKIIFKMDIHGNGTLIEKSRLNEVMGIQTDYYTFDKFRYICILSGCDYLPSISGIGLAKANKVFKSSRQGDVKQILKKLPTYLKMNVVVTNEYVEGFIRANNTFLHQLTFDPLTRALRPLQPHPPELTGVNLNYAGKFLPRDLAYQIALGNIDIHTKGLIYNFDPDKPNSQKGPVNTRSRHLLSIWDKRYIPKLPSSPCKEIQTSEAANRNNHKLSGVGKNTVISTEGLKRMLAKQNKDTQDPAITNKEMAALYACEDEDYQVERAKKNLMASSDGFAALEDFNETMASTNDDNEKQEFVVTTSCKDEDVKMNFNAKFKDLDVRSDSFEYTAANIGEETFKRNSHDSCKENNASTRITKHRNIFAVSKTGSKNCAGKTQAVEVKSWYFSSKESSTPITKISPCKLVSPSKTVSPRSSKMKVKVESVSHSSSVNIIFQKGVELNKRISGGTSDNEKSAEGRLPEEQSTESPMDKNVIQSDENEESTKTGALDFDCTIKSDKKKPKKTIGNFDRKNKVDGLSKLSAFSWSRSNAAHKMTSQNNGTDSVLSRTKLSSESQCESSSAVSSTSTKKHRISIDIDDSSEEPPVKMKKNSPTASNYFDKKGPNDSSSHNTDSERDIREVEYQSYEGFLKSFGRESFTKLLDEPKQSKSLSDAVDCLHSTSLMEVPRYNKGANNSKRKSFITESSHVIDLTTDATTKVKPTCRVSGLSKSKGKQRSLDSQQPKIQNFFSKYSFERKKLPQIRSTTLEQDEQNRYSDVDDDNLSISCTPILNDPVASFAFVKRKLSL